MIKKVVGGGVTSPYRKEVYRQVNLFSFLRKEEVGYKEVTP